ncbi:MAG: TRAP transporter small permease subunit [Hyphomicrobiaceae bacterium]
MPESLDTADELIAERRSLRPGNLPPDMPNWMARTITSIDTFSLWVGRIVCWLVIPLFIVMAYEIVVRKFGMPTYWAYDMSRMIYGTMFMLGAGYALSVGVHIRADFIYRGWSERTQGLIDLLLYLVFYFPGLIFFFLEAYEFAEKAWWRGEKMMDTAWAPHVGPIKSALPLGIALLLIQGVSEVLKCYYAVTRGRWPQ